jgi:hypothetical protein
VEIIDAILGLAESLDPLNDIVPEDKRAPRPRFMLELLDDGAWRATVSSRSDGRGAWADETGETPEACLQKLHALLVRVNEQQERKAKSRLERWKTAAQRVVDAVRKATN